MRDDYLMINQPITRPTFTFDDALAAISAYALALRTDSDATDSTLDELQRDLDLMLDHDATAPLDADDDDRLHPDFATFPSAEYYSIAPELATRAALDDLNSLRTAANALFATRP
jgi:hypothetical protein